MNASIDIDVLERTRAYANWHFVPWLSRKEFNYEYFKELLINHSHTSEKMKRPVSLRSTSKDNGTAFMS